MAVRLGDYKKNKQLDMIKNNIAHNVKLDTIKRLVAEMEPLVYLANDVYDTFHYIRQNDAAFANQLWRFLCLNKEDNVRINSYFAWDARCGSYVCISAYGIGIYHQTLQNDLMKCFNCNEKDLYRGKGMLLDFLSKNDLGDSILDKIIEELQLLYAHFETYANDFFECVSAYKCKEV